MPSKWTVAPEAVRIDLVYRYAEPVDDKTAPDGVRFEVKEEPFWIRIKKRLTIGEERGVQTAGWQGVAGIGGARDDHGRGPEISIDWKGTSFSRAKAYLVDWSLTDDKDVKLPLNIGTLEALNSDVFELIENAITAHKERMDAEKKATAGATSPATTSA